MAFKVRDLMIDVLTPGKFPNLTAFPTTGCCGGSLGAMEVELKGYPADGLAILQEQLKQQLALVEKQKAADPASSLPQTVEEVDMLTEKLHGALEELKAHRAQLSKKAGPSGSK